MIDLSRKKPDISTIIMVLCLFLGVVVFFYPKVSDMIVSYNIKKSQEEFSKQTAALSEEKKNQKIEELKKANEEIAENYSEYDDPFYLGKKELGGTVQGTKKGKLEPIGSIIIPNLNINLSIYEGTDDDVLKYGAGHMEKSSYPIGGVNSHSVITAHTGLSSAKFFSELINIKKGEMFFVESLGGTMAYEVIELNTVLPDELKHLKIQEGRDLVTLMTCTPEGLNTHRLLALGERREYTPEVEKEFKKSVEDSEDQVRFKRIMVIIGIIVSIILIILLTRVVWRRSKDV